jgi:2-iminobutanoate/2-iminopropanoate deaminase
MAIRKTIVQTPKAPTPVGPYSQGVVLDGWLWTCGQVALDPATGMMQGVDAVTQADRVLRNLEAILMSAGTDLTRVVKVTVYLTSMEDYTAVNEVYGEYFSGGFPARSCVEVSRLPLGALLMIDAVARVPS